MGKISLLCLVAILLVSMVSCNYKTTSNDQPSSNEDIVEINQSFIDSIHQYDELFPFSEGLAAVKKDKFGYINISGALVIPCQYLYVGPFKEGVACVVKDEDDKNISFIDTEGKFFKTKYPFNFAYYLGNSRFSYIDYGLSFQNGVCEINYSPNPNDRNQLTELITVYLDKQLKETDKPSEENNVTDKNNEFEVFSELDKDIYGDETELKGLKNKNGEIIIPAKYNNLQFSDNGVVLATMFVEDAESHQAHPFIPIPYGLKIDGYIDFNGNSTFTETDYGKIEGFKTAQLPIYNNAKLKEQEGQARLDAEQAEQEREHERQLRSESAKGPQWIDGMWRYEGYISTRMGSIYVNSALKIDRDRQTLVWVDGSDVMESGKYEVYDGSIHCNSSYWELDEANHRIGIGNGKYFFKK
ncbi:MAG: WG repeat-containing protein [Bacteroidales bacterium]|nr:WG repeat-containing protein [Bacteroidales bacterium]